MHALAGCLRDLGDGGSPAWLVRPVDGYGFGARREAESLVVSAGQRHGVIVNEGVSRLVERLVRDHWAAAVASSTPVGGELELAVHGFARNETGLSCGGDLRLLIEPVDALPASLLGELSARAPVAYAVRLGSRRDGCLVIDGCGASTSTLGDPLLDHRVEARALELLVRGRQARRVLSCFGERILLDVYAPAPRLVVVGDGAVAGALMAQAALLGWESRLAAPELGLAVAEIDDLGAGDAVVVLSHDPSLDAPVLAEAVRRGIGYVGALGGWARQRARLERLEALGLSRVAAAVHSPAGLDLGAWDPAETALSVMAEVLTVRAGGSAVPLRDAQGPIHHRA